MLFLAIMSFTSFLLTLDDIGASHSCFIAYDSYTAFFLIYTPLALYLIIGQIVVSFLIYRYTNQVFRNKLIRIDLFVATCMLAKFPRTPNIAEIIFIESFYCVLSLSFQAIPSRPCTPILQDLASTHLFCKSLVSTRLSCKNFARFL